MRILFIIIIAASLIGLSFVSKTKTADKGKAMRSVTGSYAPVAVLELFTSEGCSSCPPADNLLPQLAKLDSNIIPLSFHVDYWNRLGWTDPFSSSGYSDRQKKYADLWRLESVYTPELVINGEYEVVGSNQSEAETAIKKALQEKSLVKISIDDVKTSNGKIHVSCHTLGDWKKTDLLLVVLQKQAVMKVGAGENNGATLSHINIVRSFSSQPAAAKNELEAELPENITGEKLPASQQGWRLVVYAQQTNDLKITGAVMYQADMK